MNTPLPAKHYADLAGAYIGAFAGIRIEDGEATREEWPQPPPGSVEVPEPPPSSDHEWRGGAWQLSQTRRDSRIAAAKAAELAEFDRPVIRRLIKVLATLLNTTPEQIKARLRDAE